MSQNPSTLLLIPTSLIGKPLVEIYSERNLNQIRELEYFVVETPKIGRSFLKGLHKDRQISSLNFYTLNENTNSTISEIISTLKKGESVGVMSDAGYPGVGDMGNNLVLAAHREGIKVSVLPGPSAITQTLSGSGLNGNRFKYNGYLPKDQNKRLREIELLEKESSTTGIAQIAIETPYRAQHLLTDILNQCKGRTLLTLGIDIESENQTLKTMSIDQWKKNIPDIAKRKVIYIIQA